MYAPAAGIPHHKEIQPRFFIPKNLTLCLPLLAKERENLLFNFK